MMKKYRAYPMWGGRVLAPSLFNSDSDEHAIALVREFTRNYPIELWEGTRKVAELTPETAAA
jgi:hypothetical protein